MLGVAWTVMIQPCLKVMHYSSHDAKHYKANDEENWLCAKRRMLN